MWSGPRNISTAMMRSFSSRSDCFASDEPFYGAYLKQTGEPHVMAAEIMADMDCDWQSVAATMRGPIPDQKSVWYQKHMSHHMEGPINVDDFPDHAHVFLVRDPDLMVASYRHKNELRDHRQLGFERLVEYHDRISSRLGHPAPVIDSNRLLADPERGLRALCDAIEIAWEPAMLSWPKGPHHSDGIWASHWYNAVWDSEGFGNPTARSALTVQEQTIADRCRSHYDALKRYCI
jgi:hypothetical protein